MEHEPKREGRGVGVVELERRLEEGTELSGRRSNDGQDRDENVVLGLRDLRSHGRTAGEKRDGNCREGRFRCRLKHDTPPLSSWNRARRSFRRWKQESSDPCEAETPENPSPRSTYTPAGNLG